MRIADTTVDLTHFHLFCGLGGGARGFNRGEARVGNLIGRFRCLGGIDSDPLAIQDFGRLAGVPGTVMDLFSEDQYRRFHGKAPPSGWREASPADIRRAAQHERPDIVFTSSPCKGLSSLLSDSTAASPRYQALNELTVRGIFLTLAAWEDDPVPLIIFENVPRITQRGRHLLDQIHALLRAHGYHVAETLHDCGEIGGLAQRRKRFLLVARHATKVPPFLYQPAARGLRPVGEVLKSLPPPGSEAAGPLHRMSALQWQTWLRLAFVEPGNDWRKLKDLRVADGHLADWRILHGTGNGRAASLPDIRPALGAGTHANIYRVVPWNGTSTTITGANHVAGGAAAVADPRPSAGFTSKYRVSTMAEPAGTVIGASTTGQGAFAVADPNIAVDQLPAEQVVPNLTDRLVAVIVSPWGTWNRPFTTLELATLQSLYDPGEPSLTLAGENNETIRERIGNAVPPAAAEAIAGVMGRTLLLARSGGGFELSTESIWVRPIAMALSVDQRPNDAIHSLDRAA